MTLGLLLKRSATFCWLDISAKMILLPNLQYSVQICYVLRQGVAKLIHVLTLCSFNKMFSTWDAKFFPT